MSTWVMAGQRANWAEDQITNFNPDIRKSADTQIRALLDSNQQKKWDEMQAKREQWGQNRHHGPPDASDQQGPPPQQ